MTDAPLDDQPERTRAIRERERNVIVDAGAGTGKTTLLVHRMLHLIAPDDDGPAFPLDRIAAITFTRKAAGELKLRLRQALLKETELTTLSPVRARRLQTAVETLDNALISTVHSFADRLLRLRPADARVSPQYEIVEDPAGLIDETFAWLLEAAERGSLASTLQGTQAADRAAEATQTLSMYQAAGLLVRTRESEFYAWLGLNAFVHDVIQSRDRRVIEPTVEEPDLASMQRCVQELVVMVGALPNESPGTRVLRRLSTTAAAITDANDIGDKLRLALDWKRECDSECKRLKQGEHFDEDDQGWQAKRWLAEGKRGRGKRAEDRPGGCLMAALVAPLMAYMSARLVRLRPVILARYDTLKRAQGVLDQVDLLIELRNLLQNNLTARAFYQARLDHLLVDEFQDTDPLQAEIVIYLCERGAKARQLDDVVLAPGKLTIVGDPKQSIYRFRRADIAMYAEVCERIRKGPVCEAQLSANFRSATGILHWLNDAFDEVLGAAGDGPRYNKQEGSVRNVRLAPSDKSSRDPGAGVHVIPFGSSILKADESRDLEGQALARYLRHLVEDDGTQIADPRTGKLRKPHYGDIAVMVIATQTVHHLTTELDRICVPHVVRGGTLFMQDLLHRQFVLGLRAISDRNDGVARAALMRPPFFAISLEDLVRERQKDKTPAMQATEQLLTQLRKARHETTPGEMARRVLEQTGFGRYVASGVNGAQRIARLYELCLKLDEIARTHRLDYDGVTAIARSWIDAPIRIEAPLPVDADAVQIITAHQAKGLEWPIVALWDGRASWRAFLPPTAFAVDAISGAWALKLDRLEHDPSHKGLQKRETELRVQERKRVAYVAATRARSILIVPEAGEPTDKTIAGTLLCGALDNPQLRVTAYESEGPAWWSGGRAVSMRPMQPMHADVTTVWADAARVAFADRLCPAGVTSVMHSASAEMLDVLDPVPRALRASRYGPVFGATVHRALELLLMKRAQSADVATQAAALAHGLVEHQDAALADVLRVERALHDAGLLGHVFRLEYPISGSLAPATLLSGYIDLLIVSPAAVIVIDFKTDAPPLGEVEQAYPGYVAQVRAYGRLIELSGVAADRQVRSALLFTADGELRWVS